jgi:hypothetical protein
MKGGIWLDYCCLPQGNRDADEENYFRKMLPQIIYLATKSNVIAIWPQEQVQLRRGWCLVELAVNQAGKIASAARPNEFLISTNHENYEESGDNSLPLVNMSDETMATVRELLEAAKESRNSYCIKKWLLNIGAKCTNDSDIYVLSEAVYAAMRPVYRMGLLPAILAMISWSLELFWWILAFPILITYPLGAFLTYMVENRVEKLPPRKPSRSCLKEVVVVTSLIFCFVIPWFVFWVISLSPTLLIIVGIYPIEWIRRRIVSKVLKIKAEYISEQLDSNRNES